MQDMVLVILARIVGHKKAREIWFLCRQYNAQEALDMGLSKHGRSIMNSLKLKQFNGVKKC